ncbi:MAG: hypothetical protein M1825_003388 [Sarcosagium campestre]|nr:MAG: hypothetical protein M1825_003388 [Sarcosagium campestre]
MCVVAPSIVPLPPDVRRSIKSSVNITSLNDTVRGLLQNALDAGASQIDITLEPRKGACTVEDNGHGIPPDEFCDGEGAGLAKMYHTSKYKTDSDTHGCYGTFLSSLSALSLLSITSHHHERESHSSLTLHRGRVISRLTPAPSHQYLKFRDHGTRVSVRDLFGNMPVRVKQRTLSREGGQESDKDWTTLKNVIVCHLLAWSTDVRISVHDVDRNRKFVIRPPAPSQVLGAQHLTADLSKCKRILSQAGLVSPETRESWIPISASMPSTTVRGFISLNPAPTRNVQFISLGVHPLSQPGLNSILKDMINNTVAMSSFGMLEQADDIDDREKLRRSKDRRFKQAGYTTRQLRSRSKGVDRWLMFSLKITLLRDGSDGFQDESTLGASNTLGAILDLLREMITQFLSEHHFQPQRTGVAEARTSRRPFLLENGSTRAEIGPPPIHAREVHQIRDITTGISSQDESTDQIDDLRGSFRGMTPSGLKTAQRRIISPLQCQPYEREFHQRSDIASRIKSSRSSFAYEKWDPRMPAKLVHSWSGTTLEDPVSALDFRTVHEEIVRVISPYTKKSLLLNTRTGFVLKGDERRPLSAPATVGRMSGGVRKLVSLVESARTGSSGRPGVKCRNSTGSWTGKILKEWNNPVFAGPEASIPLLRLESQDYRCLDPASNVIWDNSQSDTTGSLFASIFASAGRLSRHALKTASVIAQIDGKFILVKIDIPMQGCTLATESSETRRGTLVIIDQHAADERCRIECLLREMFLSSDASEDVQSQLRTTRLEKELSFKVSDAETRLLEGQRAHFAKWGIEYAVSGLPAKPTSTESDEVHLVRVSSVPAAIVERCKLQPQLLANLIRAEAWKMDGRRMPVDLDPDLPDQSGNYDQPTLAPDRDEAEDALDQNRIWTDRLSACPQGIREMMNSKACRGAIMFNDKLSLPECRALVSRLAECAFPFQCAHGRPSAVPLVDLGVDNFSPFVAAAEAGEPTFQGQGAIQSEAAGRSSLEQLDFTSAFAAWQEKEDSRQLL